LCEHERSCGTGSCLLFQLCKITQQGLLDFVQNFDLDFPDLKNMMNIPEFDNIAFEVMLNNNSGSSNDPIVPSSLKDSFIFHRFLY
jgi:hypothetical protein